MFRTQQLQLIRILHPEQQMMIRIVDASRSLSFAVSPVSPGSFLISSRLLLNKHAKIPTDSTSESFLPGHFCGSFDHRKYVFSVGWLSLLGPAPSEPSTCGETHREGLHVQGSFQHWGCCWIAVRNIMVMRDVGFLVLILRV